MNYCKKLGAVLLVVILLFSIIPTTVFANAESATMSEEFSKVLTDGKVVLDFAKPTSMEDEMIYVALENFLLHIEDFDFINYSYQFDISTFPSDFSKIDLTRFSLNENRHIESEETHTVDVVWNYDEDVLKEAKSIVENFPDEWSTGIYLELSDLELINYCVYNKPLHNNYNGPLANYSSQLKDAVGGSNFYFDVQLHGQADPLFYTGNGGNGRLMHNNIGYCAVGVVSAKADHAIYVPENTPDTKDALIAAAQKRVDDYIGKNVIKITDSEETVSAYYEKELAAYDASLTAAIAKLDEVRALLAEEEAKEESLRDLNRIQGYTRDITACEQLLELIAKEEQKEKPDFIEMKSFTDTSHDIYDAFDNKVRFIHDFEEGGIYHFLNDAAGEYIFDVEVVEKGETYKFVVIKDDTKLTVPTYASTDFKTNISVSTDSSEVPLDTNIKVDKITHGKEHHRICKVLDIEDGEMFDIKLHSNSADKHITKLENGKFLVKIPVPGKYKGKEVVVFYVDADDKITEYTTTVDKHGYACFETDHFSIYTLAAKSDNTPPSPSTGDNSNIFLWLTLLLISGFAITVMTCHRKQQVNR